MHPGRTCTEAVLYCVNHQADEDPAGGMGTGRPGLGAPDLHGARSVFVRAAFQGEVYRTDPIAKGTKS